MSVVILGNDDDAHIPYVTRHLPQQPIIIGPRLLVDETEISILPLVDNSLVVDGKNIGQPTSFWYRKPWSMLGQLRIPPSYKEYAHGAIRKHIGAISSLYPAAFWVSDYFSILRAEYKPLQLKIAKQLGFRVPDTLFTSDQAAAQRFVRSHAATIIKSTTSHYPQPKNSPDGSGVVLWARKVTRHAQLELEGLHLAPAIFQEAIGHTADLRVTVVGEKLFAARIVTTKAGKKYEQMRDWRVGVISGDMIIEKCLLPDAIADKCRALVKKLNLQFGAIDLVLDKSGNYWFLEVNPNGQWAFIEDDTGYPIGREIADILSIHDQAS